MRTAGGGGAGKKAVASARRYPVQLVGAIMTHQDGAQQANAIACSLVPCAENFSGRNGAILPAITNQSAFDPSTLSDFVFGRISFCALERPDLQHLTDLWSWSVRVAGARKTHDTGRGALGARGETADMWRGVWGKTRSALLWLSLGAPLSQISDLKSQISDLRSQISSARMRRRRSAIRAFMKSRLCCEASVM